jgi:glyoxylase-like metal-dependent hydrolase (beta-lactamase superfamily II)
LKQLAPHLKQPATRIGNLWLLEHGGNRILIDTGHALERPALLPELMLQCGVRMPGDLTAIVLTHRHSDHAGNAAWLRKRFGARVYCHENDRAALEGQAMPAAAVADPAHAGDDGTPGAGRPRRRFYEAWLAAYEDRAPAYCEIDGTFSDGPWQWGLRVIPTPGHTEGSVMLYHEPTRTLFTGDAIVSGPRFGGLLPDAGSVSRLARKLPGVGSGLERLGTFVKRVPGFDQVAGAVTSAARLDPASTDPKRLRLADEAFSQDPASCHLAVKRFARDAPRVDYLCPGHGPWLGPEDGIHKRLARLLRNEA